MKQRSALAEKRQLGMPLIGALLVLFAAIGSYMVFFSGASPAPSGQSFSLTRDVAASTYTSSVTALQAAQYKPLSLRSVMSLGETTVRQCPQATYADVRLTKPIPSESFCWQTSGTNPASGAWWKPQGIAGPSNTTQGNFLLVSWHGLGDHAKRSRLSVVNLERAPYTYKSIELVSKCATDLQSLCTSLDTIAGGVALVGDMIYVANASGLLAFKTSDIYVSPDGAKLVLPVAETWELSSTDACNGVLSPRITSVAVDTTSTPKRLMTAEYVSQKQSCDSKNSSDIIAWPLAGNGSLRQTTAAQTATVTSNRVYRHKSQTDSLHITGVAAYNNQLLLNDAHGTANATSGLDIMRRYTNGTGLLKTEDVYLLPGTNPQGIFIDASRQLVWTLTEGDENMTNARVMAFPFSQIL